MTEAMNKYQTDEINGFKAELRNPRLTPWGNLQAELLILYKNDNGEAQEVSCGEVNPLDLNQINGGLLVAEQAGVPTAQTEPLISRIISLGSQVKQAVQIESTSTTTDVEAASRQADSRVPDLVQMSTVEPEDVEFLAYPYLPLGKLAILEGDPEVGKTWLSVAFAATVSSGGMFPDADGKPTLACNAGNVVYMTAEDGLADTIRKRLDSAGANTERVYALQGWKGADGKSGGVTLDDLDILHKVMREVTPRLVIIDPVQGFLGAKVDAHRANQVRPVLRGISDLAAEYNAVILLIRHLSKAQQSRDIYRGMDSIDFAAAARSIITVGLDPNDSDTRVMAHLKSSLAPKGVSLAFSVADGTFRWAGKSDLTARDLNAPQHDNSDDTKLEGAKQFLLEELNEGPVPSDTLTKKALANGVTKRTLKRARKELKEDGALKVEQTNGIWMMSVVRKATPTPEGQEGPEGQNPLGANDGPLGPLPQDIETEGLDGQSSGGHMAPWEFDPNYKENQQFIAGGQGGHPNALREFSEKSGNGPLGSQEVGCKKRHIPSTATRVAKHGKKQQTGASFGTTGDAGQGTQGDEQGAMPLANTKAPTNGLLCAECRTPVNVSPLTGLCTECREAQP